MKMLIAKKSDEILGFTVFEFEASELMASVQTEMVGHLLTLCCAMRSLRTPRYRQSGFRGNARN